MQTSGATLDQSNGGQWISGEKNVIIFKGCIMPVSNKDLLYDKAGTYTKDSRKLYTNGFVVPVNATVKDLCDGSEYTVVQELGHGAVHSLKRYMLERKAASSNR
jgi:hypothetical protein